METASRLSEIRDNGERKKLTLFNYAPSRTSPRETDAWLSRFFSLLTSKSTISPSLVLASSRHSKHLGKYAWERHEPRFWRRARRSSQLATWTLRCVLIFTRKGYRDYIISDIGRVLDKFCFTLVQYFKLEKLCDSRRTLVPTCFLTMIDHLS